MNAPGSCPPTETVNRVMDRDRDLLERIRSRLRPRSYPEVPLAVKRRRGGVKIRVPAERLRQAEATVAARRRWHDLASARLTAIAVTFFLLAVFCVLVVPDSPPRLLIWFVVTGKTMVYLLAIAILLQLCCIVWGKVRQQR